MLVCPYQVLKYLCDFLSNISFEIIKEHRATNLHICDHLYRNAASVHVRIHIWSIFTMLTIIALSLLTQPRKEGLAAQGSV